MMPHPRPPEARPATAVLLANYGGPEKAADCRPYIRNIFLDPDLIPLPGLLRPLIAAAVSRRRAPVLVENYRAMGRFSPILEETRNQADALGKELGEGYRCYVGMRYWNPLIEEACARIRRAGHRKIVLLPLYPQESSTTTGSVAAETRRCLDGWDGELAIVRPFFDDDSFLDTVAGLTRETLEGAGGGARVLFAAHGLPLSVARRDPYPAQVLDTVRRLCGRLGLGLFPVSIPGVCAGPDTARGLRGGEAALAWQSRVGPMKWLEPSVEDVLLRWAREGEKRVVLVPVAFVSEHSETLYELDVLYRGMAERAGLAVHRVPTVRTSPAFIHGLARRVREAAEPRMHGIGKKTGRP